VQLITQDGQFVDTEFAKVLTDSSEFAVIGVVGGQGCGKSNLLNHILGVSAQEGEGFTVSQHANLQRLETVGIWAQVNSDRIIGLDCQAFGCGAALAAGGVGPPLSSDLPPGIVPQQEVESPQAAWQQQRRLELQRLIFMIKVCNTLVVVSEEGGGTEIWEQLQTAEMLSRGGADPSLYGLLAEERAKQPSQEYLPVVVFVHSKVEEGSQGGNLLKSALGELFGGSRLLHHHPPRVCLLPCSYTPGPTLQDRLSMVMAEVLETPRPRFPKPITEEEWLHGCGAVWQDVDASKELDQYERFWSGTC